MSTIKVNKIENTATADGGIAIDASGHVTVDGQQLPTAGALSNRNLIINGAMNVAQRGTSSTSNGYGTLDRFRASFNGGAVTQSQQDLSSGDPYNEGFRHFYRIQNTTATTASSHYREILYNIEAQDLAQSGWQYTSSSSYVTLSFWARASVAQDYYVFWMTRDGADKIYSFPITLAANTWTKITETIPGNTGITISNDNGDGMLMSIVAFYGTTYTDSGNTDRTWRDRSAGNDYTLDMTNTWANTTNATFDLTGVQVEVGEKATPFEHRSYGDELEKCKRYYRRWEADASNAYRVAFVGHFSSTTQCRALIDLSPEMRTAPSLSSRQTSDFDVEPFDNTITGQPTLDEATNQQVVMIYTSSSAESQGDSAWLCVDVSGGYLELDAEL